MEAEVVLKHDTGRRTIRLVPGNSDEAKVLLSLLQGPPRIYDVRSVERTLKDSDGYVIHVVAVDIGPGD